jgi:hypothetical protein
LAWFSAAAKSEFCIACIEILFSFWFSVVFTATYHPAMISFTDHAGVKNLQGMGGYKAV